MPSPAHFPSAAALGPRARPPRQAWTRGSVVAAALLAAAAAGAPAAPSPAGPTQLDPIHIVGSRIRTTDELGPSPVLAYEAEDIRRTGAMTLADFLRLLPQNYTGIAAGRGSVPNELNPEFGQRTETTLPLASVVLGGAAAPPGQTGVSGAGLRGLGSGSTLVLVDGRRLPNFGEGNRATDSRQGFVNLNSIPLGMIERIEVTTDGASAIYGADAVAGVINVILRRNYTGAELDTRYRGAGHGGARERYAGLTVGISRGPLQVTANLEYYERASLKASARAFSNQQNHRAIQIGTNAQGQPVFGRDLRLNWGYPAVVQAVSGNLAGVFGADGNPVRVALVPEGTDGRNLTPAQFIPGVVIPPNTALFASQQRRGNTAEFIDLVPESKRRGLGATFRYQLGPRAEAYGHLLHQETRGLFATQPAVSAASATTGFGSFATVVPAAYNPFGQDVFVGLIHRDFGSVTQATDDRAASAVAGVRGSLAGDWRWDAAVTWGRERTARVTRELSDAAVTDALRNPDPAQRLNPFVDARATGPLQAGLYERLAAYTRLDSRSERAGFDVAADGVAFTVPGGGVAVAGGGELAVEKFRSGSSTAAPASGRKRSQALFAEVRLPVFGARNARPGLQRFDLHFAGRYEDQERAGTTANPKVGFSWAPHAALLLRGSYSTGFRAPDLTEYSIAASTLNTSVTDPRRSPAATTGVQVARGSNPGIRPETSRNAFLGFLFEPRSIPGLVLEVNRYATRQDDAIRVLSAQTIVNAEAAFPGRVTRAAPDASDAALNQPGRITAVNTTLINFGRVRNASVDFRLDYRRSAGAWGRVGAGLNASRTLAASFDVTPGQTRDDRGDTFAPPKWTWMGTGSWEKGPWNASVFVQYLGAFTSNAAGNPLAASERYRAWTRVDVRAGREFPQGLWRGHGKGLRLGVGLGNVFDRDPPFSDTVFGFNGGLHSPLGRTWELTLALPLR